MFGSEEPKCIYVDVSGRSVHKQPSCVHGRKEFGSGENRSVRGKTVIPRTMMYDVMLWDDSSILGLSAILWRCSPTV